MATREHADSLLQSGKRKAGLRELREVVAEHRDFPAHHAPLDTVELLIHLAYEIRFNRKTGMTYFGRKAAEAASLMEEARTLLESSGARADHPAWARWYSVTRRLHLIDGDPLKAADVVGEQIRALVALGDVDPETIEYLRDLKRRDENLP